MKKLKMKYPLQNYEFLGFRYGGEKTFPINKKGKGSIFFILQLKNDKLYWTKSNTLYSLNPLGIFKSDIFLDIDYFQIKSEDYLVFQVIYEPHDSSPNGYQIIYNITQKIWYI